MRKTFILTKLIEKKIDPAKTDEKIISEENKEVKNVIENLHNEYTDQTVIYISHSLNTLKRCDHIYEIKNKIFKKIK